MCINDISGSHDQEGTLQRRQHLLCKIGDTVNLSSTQNSWYGDSCSPCAIDNNDSVMFYFKFINEKITGIGDKFVMAKKLEKEGVICTGK